MNAYQLGFIDRMTARGVPEIGAVALLHTLGAGDKRAGVQGDPVKEFVQSVANSAKRTPGTQSIAIKWKTPLMRAMISQVASRRIPRT
jgi:hypothetical protein